jgi:hypothetical protein
LIEEAAENKIEASGEITRFQKRLPVRFAVTFVEGLLEFACFELFIQQEQ